MDLAGAHRLVSLTQKAIDHSAHLAAATHAPRPSGWPCRPAAQAKCVEFGRQIDP